MWGFQEMAEQSLADTAQSGDRQPDVPNADKVGHLQLGNRHFIVELASGHPYLSGHDEICRFELAGLNLIVIETVAQPTPDRGETMGDLAERLTGREIEIAVLVAQGHANKVIAYRLQISEWTVATYLRRIFAKLNVASRAAMVFRCAPLINASLAPQREGAVNHHGHVRVNA
jgi:DNA-binding CsgD family transcriptional regulator